MLDAAAIDADELGGYAKRIRGALEKSMREAKFHSSWSAPDLAYEEAMQGFAADALDAARPSFLNAFVPFVERVARLGVDNSLAQTVLKLTLPGMPDIYQGAEMWDLSLVDPDNRRPVDYSSRSAVLQEIEGGFEADRRETMRRLYAGWRNGAVKLAVTTALLGLRREKQGLFADGAYEAVEIVGDGAENAIGFTRTGTDDQVIVLVARLPAAREDRDWSARVAGLPAGRWLDVLTGTIHEMDGGELPLARIFADLPVAVLISPR